MERVTVRLSPEVVEALDKLARGRTRSDAVRDAILLVSGAGVGLDPVLQRLDRIETLLAGGVTVAQPSTAEATDSERAVAEASLDALAGW